MLFIHHFHRDHNNNTPCLPLKILHNCYLRFMLGRDNYAKFWGVTRCIMVYVKIVNLPFFKLRVRLGPCWTQLHYANVLGTLPLLWLAFARLRRKLGQNSPMMQFEITLTQSSAHLKIANKATILVKNLEALVSVSPSPMLIWGLRWSQCFKIRMAQHWGGRRHISQQCEE